MSRIRSVHPAQWTDDQFVTCSPLARLIALGVRNESDDNGVFEWNPVKLKIRLLPLDDCDLGQLLSELLKSKQVMRFSIDGKEYGMVRNFQQYQKPRKPTFYYPVPPNSLPKGYRLNPRYGETGTPPDPHPSGKSTLEGIGRGIESEIEYIGNEREGGRGSNPMPTRHDESKAGIPLNYAHQPRSQTEWSQILCLIRKYPFEQLAKVKVYAMFKRWIDDHVCVGELVDANAVVVARKGQDYVPPVYLDWAVREIIEQRVGGEHGRCTTSDRACKTIVEEVEQINNLTPEEKLKIANWEHERSL